MSREPKTPKKSCPDCGAVIYPPYKLRGRVYRRIRQPSGYNYNGCKCPTESWNDMWSRIMDKYKEQEPQPYKGVNRHDPPETAKAKRKRKAKEHKGHQSKDKR